MSLNLLHPAPALALAFLATSLHAQNASLGHGLSAAATARGGIVATSTLSPLDAVEGNPANLATITRPTLDLAATGVFASGSFQNAANSNGRLSGVSGAMPYAAFAYPIPNARWVASAAFTPDLLMRANWHYNDAPGTAGATYGFQQNEDQIIALRSSIGLARSFGSKLSLGTTLGLVYNTNNLNAPYIFQQQPQLAGLKVLLHLQTSGIGWNGSAGLHWQPTSRLRAALAWKSGTTISTHGSATGTASGQFAALSIATDPTFQYQSQVENHLPQAFNAALTFASRHRLIYFAEYDFAAFGQAFQQLPITLTQGTNPTINSIVASTTLHDAVPLNWNNQSAIRLGVESPLAEHFTLRAGYAYMTNPVPAATLLPLTAAILTNSVSAGTGWSHARWQFDAAYQAQLPASQHVTQSTILAGEYNNSTTRLMLQSLTLTARRTF